MGSSARPDIISPSLQFPLRAPNAAAEAALCIGVPSIPTDSLRHICRGMAARGDAAIGLAAAHRRNFPVGASAKRNLTLVAVLVYL